MIIIVINTVAMSIRYFQMPELYSNALEMANYVFAIIFNVECLMKLIGLGKTYFSNSWNIFDFIVVFGTNLGILFKVINTD
jgi:voltage-gated sodium channel